MIYPPGTYWRSLALTPDERARCFASGKLALAAPSAVDTPRQDAIERVTAAVAEFRAIVNPQRGDMARVARDHGIKPNSIASRMKKEQAAELERLRRHPAKREVMLVCEVPGEGQKNSKISDPKRRVG